MVAYVCTLDIVTDYLLVGSGVMCHVVCWIGTTLSDESAASFRNGVSPKHWHLSTKRHP